MNNEPWVHRINSFNVSGREEGFREGIRARDGRCVVSGVVNRRAYRGNWAMFEPAHIFPLEKENLWVEWGFGRRITDMDEGLPTWTTQMESRRSIRFKMGLCFVGISMEISINIFCR